METADRAPQHTGKSLALSLLTSQRPRNVGWLGAAGLLFGDWGTSRLYVLGLAFLVAGRSSFYLIAAMSGLILAVAWAYTQICRIYADGGGVYSAARQRSPLLGVIGALLLFADYTVTASLSAVDAFHYFGVSRQVQSQLAESPADGRIILAQETASGPAESLWSWRSPGLWAIGAIFTIGALNLLGPKHTAGFAVATALGMIAITLLVVGCALPQVHWNTLDIGTPLHPPLKLWEAFVAIVLALSGVEAIANLTGVMKKPVYGTAGRSIWTVACEVAAFNLLLAVVMVAVTSLGRQYHTGDMLAFLAGHYLGTWGEWPVRIVGGLLLLSATNTAVNGLLSIMYVMSRDGELPPLLQKLNSFGSPWIATAIAAAVPAIVLFFAHDLETLASLYAIGVVGAVAINVTLCALHPRLRRWWRKVPMLLLGLLLVAIELTLACTKLHALAFVCIVLAVGLLLRQVTRYRAARHPKPSLLRQAIMAQLTPEALSRPRVLLATAGSAQLADAAMRKAKKEGAALVVSFIRTVSLSYLFNSEKQMAVETDAAAQAMFIEFLDHGHRHGVPVIPMYDRGSEPAELIAELAALMNVRLVMIGTSRRGALHQLIKGSFQKKLEGLLPSETEVEVLNPVPTEHEPLPLSLPLEGSRTSTLPSGADH